MWSVWSVWSVCSVWSVWSVWSVCSVLQAPGAGRRACVRRVWGVNSKEAPIRLCPSSDGVTMSNVELKPVDHTVTPTIALAAVIQVGPWCLGFDTPVGDDPLMRRARRYKTITATITLAAIVATRCVPVPPMACCSPSSA